MDGIENRIARNTLFNLGGHAWTVLMTLALTPYIISHVGLQRFGIWAVIGVLTRHFGMLDFCLGQAFVKFVAESHAERDTERLHSILNAGAAFGSVFAVVAAGLLALAGPPLLPFLGVPAAHMAEARQVLAIGLVLFALMNALRVYPSLCDGLQRMDITNLTGLATTAIWIGGTLLSMERGYGLAGLAVSQLLSYLAFIVTIAAFSRRLAPGFRFRPWRANPQTVRQLFAFGIRVQADRAAALINLHLDKLLVASALGVAAAGFYELAAKIANALRSLPPALTSAVLPAASDLHARERRDEVHELHLLASRYVASMAVLASVLLVGLAPEIVRAWLGPGYEQAVPVLRILAVAGLCAMSVETTATFALGLGRPDLLVRQAVTKLVLNLVGSIVLLQAVGFLGAALGTLLASAVAMVYLLVLFHRAVDGCLARFARRVFGPLLPAAAAGAAGVVAAIALASRLVGADPGRIESLARLGIGALIGTAAYVAVLVSVHYFDARDWALVQGLIGRRRSEPVQASP